MRRLKSAAAEEKSLDYQRIKQNRFESCRYNKGAQNSNNENENYKVRNIYWSVLEIPS